MYDGEKKNSPQIRFFFFNLYLFYSGFSVAGIRIYLSERGGRMSRISPPKFIIILPLCAQAAQNNTRGSTPTGRSGVCV